LQKFIIKVYAKEVHYTVNHETGEKIAAMEVKLLFIQTD
jgi:hypothetical protein